MDIILRNWYSMPQYPVTISESSQVWDCWLLIHRRYDLGGRDLGRQMNFPLPTACSHKVFSKSSSYSWCELILSASAGSRISECHAQVLTQWCWCQCLWLWSDMPSWGLEDMSVVWCHSKAWRIIRVGIKSSWLHVLPLRDSVGSFQWWHKFRMLKELSQLSRRIRQRRAAHRRAQRKATGTLLTVLRPVSHCGLWSWVLFGI